MTRARGFTLIEVMVALGIVAIALVAGLKATAALASNALRQSDMLLAQLCTDNALVTLRLTEQANRVSLMKAMGQGAAPASR